MIDHLQIRATRIIVQAGDVTKLAADAIVSPDFTDFFASRGPARAIAKASGTPLRQIVHMDHPAHLGEVIVTAGGSLAATHIIHVAVFDSGVTRVNHKDVERSISNVLIHAEQQGFQTIGFPAFTVVPDLFPDETCAKVMITSFFDYFLRQDSNIKHVSITVFDSTVFHIYQHAFKTAREIYQL